MTWLDTLGTVRQDLRYGARSLRRDRFAAGAVIGMLALGIGANTAIFTLLNAMWLRPLPYSQPDRLVTLLDSYPKAGVHGASPTVPEFLDIRAWSRAFERMAFLDHRDAQVTGGPEPVRVYGARVTASFFPLLGVDASLGRVFRDDENRPGNENVAILSDGLWRRAFAADPQIVGRTLMLNDSPHTVVGVLPRAFAFDHVGLGIPEDVEIYTPFLMNDYYTLRSGGHSNVRRVRTLARLAPGYDAARADAEMKAVAHRLVAEHPALYHAQPSGEDLGFTIQVRSLQEAVAGGSRTVLALMFGAVGMVLLIACANTAQFLYARALQRQDEVTIRRALGATRGRLIRQFLSESLMLAAGAGALGFLCSQAIVRILAAIVPARSLLLVDVNPDATVLAFSLGLASVTAIVFGLLPALSASGPSEARLLVTRAGRSGPRQALVAIEVALSIVLLVGAAILMRGMLDVYHTPRGFSPDAVTVMQIRMQGARQAATQPNPSVLYQQYVNRIREIPGVHEAAVFSGQPVMFMESRFTVEGRAADVATLSREAARYDIVGPGYFRAFGIPLIEGREFAESDTPDRPRVAIVNAELARRMWPNESAVGKRLGLGRDVTIVGVVGNVRMFGPSLAVTPGLYVPSLQNYEPNAAIAVRTARGTSPPLQAIKEAIWTIAPEQAVFNIRSMDVILAGSVAEPRFNTVLIASFALLAVLLSAAGVSSVVSYLVSRRAQEIAIRMAIGARRGHVLWLVSRQTLAWAIAGTALGLAGAAAGSRALAGAVQGVGRLDAATLAASAVLYLAVALLAAYLPARRASTMDPLQVLRRN